MGANEDEEWQAVQKEIADTLTRVEAASSGESTPEIEEYEEVSGDISDDIARMAREAVEKFNSEASQKTELKMAYDEEEVVDDERFKSVDGVEDMRWDGMTVIQLKDALRERDLKVSG